MKRFHVHLSVTDLASSIQFYSGLFGVEPTVTKDDYAKWMLDDPHINFAISQRGAPVGLNHLGFQVESNEELEQLNQQLQGLQSEVIEEKNTACCYAKSDKYWINDPQGIAWEQFHTLDSIPVFGEKVADSQASCCVPVTIQPMTKAVSTCCTPTHSTSSQCC
jgi:catechol 2,3-dioxygenase-like lactoylglutathione lyase family enzyme